MGCRGAIHCAHLGSRGIPQGAMNCAPTPCAYLKCIDPCGQPWEVGLKLVRLRSPWPLKFALMGQDPLEAQIPERLDVR